MFGNEAPITVNRGKVHEYLGMTLDYSTPGKVKFEDVRIRGGHAHRATSRFEKCPNQPSTCASISSSFHGE